MGTRSLLIHGFNTSYVKVQLLPLIFMKGRLFSFNTSYVKVQLLLRSLPPPLSLVSIHLMLRFNDEDYVVVAFYG